MSLADAADAVRDVCLAASGVMEPLLTHYALYNCSSCELINGGKEWILVMAGEEYFLDVACPMRLHPPRNEREYLRSPQKAIWRTARELKMDDYIKLCVFGCVYESAAATAGQRLEGCRPPLRGGF
jgi:hypothetical protein